MIKKEYVDCPSKRRLKFKDLEVGQIFLDEYDNLCMKIKGCTVNYINLEYGIIDWLEDDEEVRLINKDINITFSDDDIVCWTAKKED